MVLPQTKELEGIPKPTKSLVASDYAWDKEWIKCHLDPIYFILTYGHINDEDKGIVPFTPYPHLVSGLKILEEDRLTIFLKSRQVGFTWLMAHYALWTALFHKGAKVLVLSKSEEAAGELISYCRFIYTNLPPEFRVSFGKDQSSLLTFPALNSQIRALASTETAGIGFGGASLVILDEFAFHPYAKENYAEIKPMIDAGGNRKLIIGSAPNKLEFESKFNEIWFGAKTNSNNFVPILWAYDVMPYRDEAWYQARALEYDPLELATRYFKTEEEALSSTKGLCRFDVDSVKKMISDAYLWRPIETRYNGLVQIYKKSVAGAKYVFAIDPSEGDYDPSVGIIFDWRTNEEVAEYQGHIPIDEQARISWELYQEYNSPLCAPEINAGGTRLLEKLEGFGVKNFYCWKKDKKGWRTHSANRPVIIGDLAEIIFQKNIVLHNPASLNQFLTFIRTPKMPEGEATKGAHDDYVMAVAIAQQIRKEMPGTDMRVFHSEYRD